MKRLFPRAIALAFVGFGSLVGTLGAQAAVVNVDLGSATTGTIITGVGASFSQQFTGQTVSGISLTGAPTGPLSLSAGGSIDVAAFDPGVSPASNSLLSQPGNAAPLAMLLGSAADSLTWTMGFGNGGSVLATLYGLGGAVIGSQTFSGLNGYGVFSLSGLGVFQGVTFSNNNDTSGLRFMNFSYNAVPTNAVPEPVTLALVGLGLAGLGFARRRRQG